MSDNNKELEEELKWLGTTISEATVKWCKWRRKQKVDKVGKLRFCLKICEETSIKSGDSS